ncbi:hypothetical protein RJ639_039683 [Escallonia herrerae]|uniref:CBF1-interacting co-repressor CIR N-terminal domain-containing protein n=1 Tax=Escallonia herrerae TaxID=1293975 RepID=A0AA88WN20_9ASTE|nr:hypothetical protein RJ639_039683 [Escallonia herrerae]
MAAEKQELLKSPRQVKFEKKIKNEEGCGYDDDEVDGATPWCLAEKLNREARRRRNFQRNKKSEMALKFLNKKGWHTGNLRNIENVWKAEKKHDAEQKKLEELRKQI